MTESRPPQVSRVSPPRPSPAEPAAAALSVLAFILPALRPVTDPDVWWHLKAGREILAHPLARSVESWSFTAAGRPWINHEWGAEALLAAARRIGGDPGVALVGALLMGATALLLYLACRRSGLSGGLAAFLIALGALAAGSRYIPRPQLFSYLCLAWLLERLAARRAGAGRLWPIFAIQVLWSNTHGPIPGLAFGIPLLLGGGAGPLSLRRRLLAVLGLIGASLVTPYGARALLDYLPQLGQGALYHRTIREWLPLASPGQRGLFEAPATWLAMGIAALSALALLASSAGRQRWGFALVLLAVSAAPLAAVRHRDLLSIALAPAAAVAWAPLGRRRAAPIAGFAAAALCLAIPSAGWLGYPATWPPRPSIPEAPFPRGAVDFLKVHGIGSRIFNAYDYGGYLAEKLAPRWRVFVDGRYFVYGEELYRQYLEIRDGAPDARALLDRYGADLLLVRYPEAGGYQALAERVRPWSDWALVFWDDADLLFVRRGAVPPAWLGEHEYRRLDPWLPSRLDSADYWRDHAPEFIGEAERAAAEAPRAVRPRLFRGLACEYAGRYAEASAAYREALALDPGQKAAREGLERTAGRSNP